MEQLRELVDLPNLYSDDVFVEYDSEDKENLIACVPKRYVRDGLNPFELYESNDFKRRYRFSKDSIMHGVLPRIENGLSKVNNRGLPIAPVFQLLLCLRFYATANFQHVSGDLFHISQSTVSRIIYRVSVMLAALMRECIKIPVNGENQIENRRLSKELGGGENDICLPGIDGAIDCTHVRICHTNFGQLQEIYRNRKGYFSLNVQAVVGPRREFLDVVPEWPGSHHDSRIFQNSGIYMRYLKGQLTGAIIGDFGYPSLPFLFTPVANPVTDAQQSYNLLHKRTRCIVERTFGIWKRRFPSLSKGLSNKLICCTTIIMACDVLHNISLLLDNVLLEDEEPYVEEEQVPVAPPHWQPEEGFAIREALINRLFN